MSDKIAVHPRVHARHPEIDDEDARAAWNNAIALINRSYSPPDIYAAAGLDGKGRMLKLLGAELEDDSILIFHAMKLPRKMSRELGLG